MAVQTSTSVPAERTQAGPKNAPLPGRRATFWLLLLPSAAWLLLLLVLPVLLMALYSFRTETRGSLLEAWTPTLGHYGALLARGSYWRLLATSAFVAFVVASFATLLAYPLAYFLAFRAGKRAGIYLLLLLVPFWTSYLLRVMALKIMLGSSGVINAALLSTGLIGEPLTFLLYNRTAVTITLIYVWIPFIALPILAALQRIDPALTEAAADLGAPPRQQFLRVTLPLSAPGVLAGFFMVFIPTIGEYVTPGFVGGSSGLLFGNIVQDFFTKTANWSLGSAMAMVMLAATFVLVLIATRLIDVRKLVG
jgi:spermidine/putrescine transport system permease protein